MQPPRIIRAPNGDIYTDRTFAYLVEYELWAAKGAMRSSDMLDLMCTKYGKRYLKGNVGTQLGTMVAHGRAERLARGIYVHVDFAAIFS